MIEFNTIQELKPNTELLGLIKDFTYTINKEELEELSNNYIVVYLDMITNNYYTKDYNKQLE